MISIGFLFLANSLEILSPKPEVFLNTHPARFPLLIDGFGVSRRTARSNEALGFLPPMSPVGSEQHREHGFSCLYGFFFRETHRPLVASEALTSLAALIS